MAQTALEFTTPEAAAQKGVGREIQKWADSLE